MERHGIAARHNRRLALLIGKTHFHAQLCLDRPARWKLAHLITGQTQVLPYSQRGVYGLLCEDDNGIACVVCLALHEGVPDAELLDKLWCADAFRIRI